MQNIEPTLTQSINVYGPTPGGRATTVLQPFSHMLTLSPSFVGLRTPPWSTATNDRTRWGRASDFTVVQSASELQIDALEPPPICPFAPFVASDRSVRSDALCY